MTHFERKLPERLATEGTATRLALGEIEPAKSLETDGLVFLVADTAVVTPKGRRLLAKEETKPKRGKPPSGLLV